MRVWKPVTRARAALVPAVAVASMLLAPPVDAAQRFPGPPFPPPHGRLSLNLSSIAGADWQRPGAARAAGNQSAEGVVQSVGPRAVVLRELDGTIVTVLVGSETRVYVDGRPDVVADVRPGYVAAATWSGGAPASVLVVVPSN